MHTLTTRGRTVVAVGLVLLGAGWGLGQPAMTTVAVLLLAVPAFGAAIVRRSRFVLGSTRAVHPSRFAVGTEADVVLTVENGSRYSTGLLLLTDRVPATLGEPAQVLLDRIPANAQRSEHYRLTGRVRGLARVGPLSVTVVDPFGMATLTRSFTATNPVMVTPAIVPLRSSGSSTAPGGRGETMFRSLAARGDDDVLPREHRSGDDMRRIHWRATARLGELMVRREEQAWHSSLAVVIDDRVTAHYGQGAESTFEWVVSAAASVADHYLRQGWQVSVLTTTGRALAEVGGSTGADQDQLLQAFCDIRMVPDAMGPGLVSTVSGVSAVVAVLGRLGEDAAAALGRPTSAYSGCLVLAPGPVGRLTANGWRASPWTPGDSVADAWTRIAPLPTGVAS